MIICVPSAEEHRLRSPGLPRMPAVSGEKTEDMLAGDTTPSGRMQNPDHESETDGSEDARGDDCDRRSFDGVVDLSRSGHGSVGIGASECGFHYSDDPVPRVRA